MAEEDKRVLVKALLDLKGEVDALSERVKELESGAAPKQLAGPAGFDSQRPADDAEWQEQVEDLSIRKANNDLIEKALEKHGGNVKAAAEELGISERTIYRKLAKKKQQ